MPEPVTMLGDAAAMCRCQNCRWTGNTFQLNPIHRYADRVHPGEIAPAGECPECGALAHLITAEDEAEKKDGYGTLDPNYTYATIDSAYHRDMTPNKQFFWDVLYVDDGSTQVIPRQCIAHNEDEALWQFRVWAEHNGMTGHVILGVIRHSILRPV